MYFRSLPLNDSGASVAANFRTTASTERESIIAVTSSVGIIEEVVTPIVGLCHDSGLAVRWSACCSLKKIVASNRRFIELCIDLLGHVYWHLCLGTMCYRKLLYEHFNLCFQQPKKDTFMKCDAYAVKIKALEQGQPKSYAELQQFMIVEKEAH